jgi:fucose permease
VAPGYTVPRVAYLFLIISSLLVLSAAAYVALFIKDRCAPNQIFTKSLQKRASTPSKSAPSSVLLCTLFGVFMFCCAGLEVSFGGLVFTYAVEHLEWSPGRAVFLTFGFWACVATGRGVGVLLVRVLSARSIVCADLVGAVAALAVLVGCSGAHPAVEWTCSCVLGAALSTLVATTLNLAYSYVRLSGRLASVFMCCNYAGIMVLPGVTGYCSALSIEGASWFRVLRRRSSLLLSSLL